MTASALYHGAVVHRRFTPKTHALSYRVFSLLADLDELPDLSRRLTLFGYNRRAVLSLHDRDHGPGDGTPLKEWVTRELDAAGIAAGGPIRLLCYPRLWGYTFNPLSVFWCHRPDGSLAAVLHEVHNTFGDRHCYLAAVDDREAGAKLVRHSAAKDFHVSPFLPMDLTYHFTLRPPGEKVAVGIDETDPAGTRVLHASFGGTRRALSDAEILRSVVRHPLMTVKVIAGIHWEALRLWRKGLTVYRHAGERPPLVTVAPRPIPTEPA